ncbi:MAG: hypothetical protein AB1938_00060 [Myxococcota bacterium]
MKPDQPYPTHFRVALLVAVTVGALVSYGAAEGMSAAIMAPDLPRDDGLNLGAVGRFIPYAKEQEQALKASQRAALGAIESMGASRVVILFGLSAAASIVFVSALFLRWAAHAPKLAVARRLGGAAIGAAIFRTLKGAQDLVITRRTTEAWNRVLIEQNVPDAVASAGFTQILGVLSVGWTAFVVALLLALASYFRGEKVRSLLETPSGDEG